MSEYYEPSEQIDLDREFGVKPKINAQREVSFRIDAIKKYLQSAGMHKLVLGISGGQDSTLVGKLCEMAAKELRLETGDKSYQFIAVRLPYGEQADESDAMEAIKWQNADKVMRVNIKPMTDAAVKSVEANGTNDTKVSDFNKGNIKARMRMIVQYAIAGAHQGLVIGTDHPAEAITGFYTKYGDGGTDFNPIEHLDKRQGKQLLAYLGAPKHLYTKAPTADLEDGKPGLPDEKALHVRYSAIDDFLEGRPISKKDLHTILGWYHKTQHKRHMPADPYSTWVK